MPRFVKPDGRRPLELSLVAPVPVPVPVPVPLRIARRGLTKGPPHVATAPRALSNDSLTHPKPTLTPAVQAPRVLTIPSLAHLPAPASQPTHATGPEWLSRELAAWKAAQNARFGARGALVELAQKLEQGLSPHSAHVARAEATRAQIAALLQASRHPAPSERLEEEVAPAARQELHELWRDDNVRICAGNCGQKHDVSHTSAVLHLDHDLVGRVHLWRLELPSGNASFDTRVLAQAAALEGVALGAFANEPVPEWSEWRFEETGYRWSAIERALDPLFRPPGVVDDASSDWVGLTTVTADVQLVAVVYRAPASNAATP